MQIDRRTRSLTWKQPLDRPSSSSILGPWARSTIRHSRIRKKIPTPPPQTLTWAVQAPTGSFLPSMCSKKIINVYYYKVLHSILIENIFEIWGWRPRICKTSASFRTSFWSLAMLAGIFSFHNQKSDGSRILAKLQSEKQKADGYNLKIFLSYLDNIRLGKYDFSKN